MRAGRNKIARSNANIASNDSATARNGKEISQMNGHRTRARMAIGQHSTNKKHHPSNRTMVFTGSPLNSYGRLNYTLNRTLQLHQPFGVIRRREPELRVEPVGV